MQVQWPRITSGSTARSRDVIPIEYRVTITHLVEAVLATVTNINNLDDFGNQTLIEHITLTQLRFEIRGTGEDEPSHINFVLSNVMLHCQFGDFADIVMTLFITKTRETQSGLSSTTVLLGQINGELVDDFPGVACDGAEKGTVTIHDDESEFGVGFEQFLEGFGMEFVVTQVKRPVM